MKQNNEEIIIFRRGRWIRCKESGGKKRVRIKSTQPYIRKESNETLLKDRIELYPHVVEVRKVFVQS